MITKLPSSTSQKNFSEIFNRDTVDYTSLKHIMTLLDKNPEFINRFGLKYFVNYPTKQNFIQVCDYYIKKMRVRGITGNDIFDLSYSIYFKHEIPRMDNGPVEKFGKYASGEVKELMGNLLLFCEERNGELWADKDILTTVLNLQKPQIEFAKHGVMATLKAAQVANFREVG